MALIPIIGSIDGTRVFLVRSTRWAGVFTLAAVLAFFPPVGAQTPNNPPDPSLAKYVGTEACETCHQDAYKSFAESAHIGTLKRAKVAEQGCEGCHGPGAEHAASGDPSKILRFSDANAAGIEKACTVCHAANLGDAHTKARLTCLTCHSAHHYQQPKSILVAPQLQLCRRCHRP